MKTLKKVASNSNKNLNQSQSPNRSSRVNLNNNPSAQSVSRSASSQLIKCTAMGSKGPVYERRWINFTKNKNTFSDEHIKPLSKSPPKSRQILLDESFSAAKLTSFDNVERPIEPQIVNHTMNQKREVSEGAISQQAREVLSQTGVYLPTNNSRTQSKRYRQRHQLDLKQESKRNILKKL